MVDPVKISVSIQNTLLNHADLMAQHLNISRDHLLEIALESFIRNSQSPSFLAEVNPNQHQNIKPLAQINQGDIYWVQLDDPGGLEAGIPHPHVIVQDNLFNHSRLKTVVACALTSNIKRINIQGTVLLEVGEANLPRQSVVEVSKISTVEKAQLGGYIGSLSEQRIDQILAGLRFLQVSFFTR